MKAMLFAAGLGTRLKPFTLNAPKALAPVNGKPLIQRNIEYLKSFGFKDFVINLHHYANQVLSFLEQNNNFECNIEISDETNQLLETGGGLLNAKKFLKNEAFLVMNVDILTNMNIHKFIESHYKNNAIVSLAVSDRESSRKLLFDSESKLCGWKNLNNNEEIIVYHNYSKELAFSGIHIINPELFSLMKTKGKFSIMSTYMDIMNTQKIVGYNHIGDILLDVGKPESIKKAEELFQ